MRYYKIIGYDNNEKQFISTKVKAKNDNEAINEVNELPINDLFFKYHGDKKPKLKGNVIDLVENIGGRRWI